jgi:hypothetical protein
MNLSIIISRLSNFLFFVQKADKCHRVGCDLQKYLTKNNIDRFFYGENEDKIWRQIKKSIGEKNEKQLKEIIIALNPVFTLYWRKKSKQLLRWKQYFKNNQLLLQRVIIDLMKLTGVKRFILSKIPIYLISNHFDKDKEIKAWFSWTPTESFIVIEIPEGLEAPSYSFQLGVLTHEFFHLILRKNKVLFSKISKIAEENKDIFVKKLPETKPSKMFLEELLVSSLAPEGYLSEKYFKTKTINSSIKPKNLLTWRRFAAYKLYPVAKEYVNDGRQIDKAYLNNLMEIIKREVK